MKIILQSVHFKASPQLEGFVNDKVGKLFRHNSRIVRADVTLHEGADGKPLNKYCEIRLLVRANDYFARKNSSSYEESVLNTVESLRKIIRRAKMKKIGRRRQFSLN